jgi:aspartyl-tRNA synthetase
MRENIKMRHRANLFFRNYLSDRGVWEIETPYLTKGTPEGAREYIIPSRLHEGEFYVLPQSPQQFKQLLMVGGMEKYFQIVRCFRDEDQRGDRQPEFTQLDMEFSFITQEEIRAFVEEMVHALVKEQYPHSSLTFSPFTVLTYKEAMERYNSDKPDLRKNPQDPTELAFAWIVDFPLFERSKDGSLSSAHHPFTHPHPDDVSRLQSDPLSVRSQAYDLVLNGFEVAGGSIRIHTHDLQQSVFDVLSISREEQEQKFGHLLRAFEFSPPPHGGIAFGLDRLYACLQGEEVIREVMAFPKTAEARDLLMGAPSDISRQALRDAHIELRKKPYQKK